MLKAGRIATVERRALLQRHQSFGMETTLSGHSELRVMADARDAGYKVTLVYVGLDGPRISAARVRQRVSRGGHDVPEPLGTRRYARSLDNLPIAMAMSDRCFVLDNSGIRLGLLVTIVNGIVRHPTTRPPAWAKRAIPALLETPKSGGTTAP